MESRKAFFSFMAALLLVLLSNAPASKSALSCSDALKDLRPCASYLMTGTGMPPAACCTGASALAVVANSTTDKQAACNCLQSAAKSVNVNFTLAKALPGNCGINLGFAIDPNMNCSTIS
ncbi:hypothetical protein NMG60_11029346 [Bertholletia excelsa]